jgi:hypothetical protein
MNPEPSAEKPLRVVTNLDGRRNLPIPLCRLPSEGALRGRVLSEDLSSFICDAALCVAGGCNRNRGPRYNSSHTQACLLATGVAELFRTSGG